MPLPKLPVKPATLLSPHDYPKAEKGKPVKPLTLIEPAPMPAKMQQVPVVRAKSPEAPAAEKPRATKPKIVETRPKSSTSRIAD